MGRTAQTAWMGDVDESHTQSGGLGGGVVTAEGFKCLGDTW